MATTSRRLTPNTTEGITVNVNDKAYILANNMYVREVYIANISGDYVTVRIGDGAIRLRKNRVFETREEAEKQIPIRNHLYMPAEEKHVKTPWDY